MTQDNQDRIFAAALELYEQDKRERFPTVDAVRKLAKVSMNDASAGMKAWRKQQMHQAAAVVVSIPEDVHKAHMSALAQTWQTAQTMANDALQAAQTGWESERAEAEALRTEMSNAYEVLCSEVERGKAHIHQLSGELEQAEKAAETAITENTRNNMHADQLTLQVTEMRERLEKAETLRTENLKEASDYREIAARYEGQVKELRDQNTALLEKLNA